MSRLLIVDGHAIIHRAYHSIPHLTHDGQPVNAVYGFYSMLLSSIDQLQPQYVIVCMDSPGPNFRNAEFLGYRARRAIPDRDLVSQFPLVQHSLEDAQIPIFTMGGYEADDLIATVARRSLKKHNKNKKLLSKVTIITGDKDLMQLVNDKIELFMPIRGLAETQVFGPSEVKVKLGVDPNQVIDLKALMGDSSDNYPGVTGIGPKGALNLLGQYHTLDNIYDHLSDISPNLKIKLETSRDDAYLSYKLATLVDNIPLKFTLRSARWSPKRAATLIPILQTYGFKSLVSRLQKQQGISSPIKKSPINDNQQLLF